MHPQAPNSRDRLDSVSVIPGVDFGSRDVLSDPDLREGIKKFSQWPTIPQVRLLACQVRFWHYSSSNCSLKQESQSFPLQIDVPHTLPTLFELHAAGLLPGLCQPLIVKHACPFGPRCITHIILHGCHVTSSGTCLHLSRWGKLCNDI